jgi:dipeptidyl aminopeptidase/acylaminoacyl peptidase
VTVTAAMCAAGRVLGEPRLAPDGSRVAFVASAGGSAALVVVDAGGGPELVLTAGLELRAARPLGGGVHDWLPDGSGLVLVARADPEGPGDPGLHLQPVGGGPSRPVWSPGGGSDASSPVVAPDGQRLACVVDERAVVVVDLDGGRSTVVDDRADFALDPVWSPDGRWLAWTAWDVPAMPWDASRVVLAPADGTGGGPVVVAGGAGSAAQQPRFSPDGSTLAVLDDRSGWLNLTLVPLGPLDPFHPPGGGRPAPPQPGASLAEPYEHGGPSWGPGQRSFAWSPDGRSLAVCRNEDGFGRLLAWVPGGEPVTLARGVHGGLSWRGDRLAAVRTGGATPTRVVVHEGGRRRTLAVGPVAGFPPCEPELVSWPSDDGVSIPGRLHRPTGLGPTAPGPTVPGRPPRGRAAPAGQGRAARPRRPCWCGCTGAPPTSGRSSTGPASPGGSTGAGPSSSPTTGAPPATAGRSPRPSPGGGASSPCPTSPPGPGPRRRGGGATRPGWW